MAAVRAFDKFRYADRAHGITGIITWMAQDFEAIEAIDGAIEAVRPQLAALFEELETATTGEYITLVMALVMSGSSLLRSAFLEAQEKIEAG